MFQSMATSDLVSIGTTLFLGSVAFLAPYIIERWKNKFYSAKLVFDFFHKPPYCHITEWKSNNDKFPVYYFRFAIINNGKIQAERCEAILEKIWKENSAGELQEIKGFTPVSLKWSGAGLNNHITIQPDRRFFCDIGRIHPPQKEPDSVYRNINDEDKKKNKFFFELPERFYSQWDCLVPGKYQIEISIYSKNANKTSRKFKISWSGNWKDGEDDMLNELVIT